MNGRKMETKKAPGKHYRNGITLTELFQLFPDDATAEKWFVKCRWEDGIRCVDCESENVNDHTAHATMPYRCRDCGKRFSVKTNSVMYASNIGYQKWAIAIYLVTTSLKGVSSMKLHRALGINKNQHGTCYTESVPHIIAPTMYWMEKLKQMKPISAEKKETNTPRKNYTQGEVLLGKPPLQESSIETPIKSLRRSLAIQPNQHFSNLLLNTPHKTPPFTLTKHLLITDSHVNMQRFGTLLVNMSENKYILTVSNPSGQLSSVDIRESITNEPKTSTPICRRVCHAT